MLSLISILFSLVLMGLPSVSFAASVTQIVGANVGVPVIGSGSASIVCTPPAWCPTFFDNDAFTGGKFYGDAFHSSGGLSNNCRVSTNGGATWTTLCAGAYPTADVPREMDVTSNNVLLSFRYESAALNLCRLDRSIDGGVSWSTVTVAAGAGFACLGHNAGYLNERLRCGGGICLAMVNAAGFTNVYKSTNDGALWTLVHSDLNAGIPVELWFNGSTGVFTNNLGGNDVYTTFDGGTTWATQTADVAGTTNCGGAAENVVGPALGGIVIGCLTFPSAGFKMINAAAALGFTPSQPSGFTFFTTQDVAVRSRRSGHVYFNGATAGPTQGRLFESINGGSTFTEMAASVSGAISAIGNHNARYNGRSTIFSTNGSTFNATQIINLTGGE